MPSSRLSPVTARTIAPQSRLLAEFADEGLIDLDTVEREAPQIAQRRIAGAEIVHGNAGAERAQLMQRRQRGVGVLQHHRLGDLQLQPIGAQLGIAQCRGDRRSPDCGS